MTLSRIVIPSGARDLTIVLSMFARFFASLRMTRVLVAFLLSTLVTKLQLPSQVPLRNKHVNWRAQHEQEILGEFSDLLAIPNLASDAPNIQRNAEAIRALCEKRGLTTQLLKHEDAPPIVVADLIAAGAKRTIAFYAHYDGQPVDRARWKTDPWKPVMRDQAGNDVDWRNAKTIDPEWRLYARSAGDDKAPIIAMLAALDALRSANAKPTVNFRFVFEGEEEAGSPHLAAYLAENRERLATRRMDSCAMGRFIKVGARNCSSVRAARSIWSLPSTDPSKVCTTAITETGCRIQSLG